MQKNYKKTKTVESVGKFLKFTKIKYTWTFDID